MKKSFYFGMSLIFLQVHYSFCMDRESNNLETLFETCNLSEIESNLEDAFQNFSIDDNTRKKLYTPVKEYLKQEQSRQSKWLASERLIMERQLKIQQKNLERLEEVQVYKKSICRAHKDPTLVLCKCRSMNKMEACLGLGANPNATDNKGTPLLIVCCDKKYTYKAKLLLDYGASINMKARNGATALKAYVDGNDINRGFLRYMLAKGAEFTLEYCNEHNLLHLLLDKRISDNLRNKYKTCDFLLSPKSTFYIESFSLLPIVEKMLNEGFDPDSVDKNGETLLHIIADSIKSIMWLENWCQKNNYQTDHFEQNDYLEIAKLLLKRGANPNIKSTYKFNLTPIHLAKNSIALMEILLDYGADPCILSVHDASIINYVPLANYTIIPLLVKKGAPLTQVDNKGYNCFHAASLKYRKDKDGTEENFIATVNILVQEIENQHGIKTVFEMLTACSNKGQSPIVIAGDIWNKTRGSEYVRFIDA